MHPELLFEEANNIVSPILFGICLSLTVFFFITLAAIGGAFLLYPFTGKVAVPDKIAYMFAYKHNIHNGFSKSVSDGEKLKNGIGLSPNFGFY